MYTLVYKTHGTKDYDPPRHHPIFRSSSSRRVNLCSSWTHAWTLNSCTIVSPRYEEGEAGEGRGGEACIQPLFQWSWPWRTEIRDKRHEKRTCAALPFPSLPRFAHDPPRRRPSYLPVRSSGHVHAWPPPAGRRRATVAYYQRL